MSVPIGITVPKMLREFSPSQLSINKLTAAAVAGTFAVPFTAYLFLLSARVSRIRVDNKAYLGEKTADAGPDGVCPLQVAVRSHANYIENIPYALILAGIVELNGGNRKVLTGSLAALLVFRILHVELGLRGKDAAARPRLIGHLGTAGFLAGMSGYALYLVKGYWGL